MTVRTVNLGLVMLALTAVLATIVLGGIVHAAGASLACPDWPLCFGQWFPTMVGPVALEHGHRLIAGFSGTVVLALSISLYWLDSAPDLVRWLGLVALILIVIQSILGGLTVLWQLPAWVSTAHFLLAQLTLGTLLMIGYGLFWPERFQELSSLTTISTTGGLMLLLPPATLGQMGLGAWLRHIGTKGGPLVGPEQADLSLFPEWLEVMTEQFLITFSFHRWLAVLIVLFISVIIFKLFNQNKTSRVALVLAVFYALCVGAQVILGWLSVQSYLSVTWVTLHLVLGVLLWLTSLLLSFQLPSVCRTTS